MRKANNVLGIVIGLSLVAGCLAGCGHAGNNEESASNYQSVNLSLTVNGTDTQIDTLVGKYFAELVAERTGGSVVIDVFPNDTLAGGNSTKGVEYIATGGADLGAYATCVLANIEPKLSVATIPWTFTSYQQAREVIDGEGGKYYEELLSSKGITYLGSFHNGFRQLTNSKRAVKTPEDIKGLKIRVPGSEVYMSFFRALEANPTAMSWSEVFTAIQQGTIDGQENGCSVTNSAKMDEIQQYMTIWNYSYENDLFVANSDIWNSLEPKTQELLQECIREACEWGRDKLESDEADLIRGFSDKGMQVDVLTEEEISVFREKIGDVVEKLKLQYGEEACQAFGIE